MFSKLKSIFTSPENFRSPNSLAEKRFEVMVEALGEPDHIDRDTVTHNGIDIYAFGRNFVEECDSDAEDDEGFVLVTSGMSEQRMSPPESFDNEETLAIELIWYVRELNPEYFMNLRWLAKLPFIDNTWFGMGHTVPMPKPPLSFCPFSTYLFLPPIIRTDRYLFEDIEQQGQTVGTLVVHMVSPQEYHLVKQQNGLDQFLDLLDENDYPKIFTPTRKSIVL